MAPQEAPLIKVEEHKKQNYETPSMPDICPRIESAAGKWKSFTTSNSRQVVYQSVHINRNFSDISSDTDSEG